MSTPTFAGHELCYVCDEYPGVASSHGGIGVALRQEAEWFAAQGLKVTVLCRLRRDRAARISINDVEVSVIPASTAPRFRALADRWKLSRSLRAILGNRRAIVICPDFAGPIAIRGFAQPLIAQIHGSATLLAKEQSKQVGRALRWFERRSLALADAHQAVSEYALRQSRECFGLALPRARQIPNPVDTKKFHPDPEVVETDLIVYVSSRLSILKGAQVLAATLGRLFQSTHRGRALIVGRDEKLAGTSARAEVMARIAPEHHGRVEFRDQIAREEMPAVMHRAGVLIVPSLIEMFPMVILEAMASGRPVVASNRGGVPELVKHEVTGLLADPAQPEEMARQLQRIVDGPRWAASLGAAARQVVCNHYTQDSVYRRTSALHHDVLAGRGSARENALNRMEGSTHES